jgi:hypothetical protein
VIVESDSLRSIDRRRLLGCGGLAAGAQLVGAQAGHADAAPTDPDAIPPDTLPGGAYDQYVAKLAAEGRFSGVVLLCHRGRTVLSPSYGMADKERGSAIMRALRSASVRRASRSTRWPSCNWHSRAR